MELRPVGETFDRTDRLAVGFDRQRRARAHRSSVEEHRARAADLRIAAELRADKAEAANELDQQHLMLALDAGGAAVEPELDLAPAHPLGGLRDERSDGALREHADEVPLVLERAGEVRDRFDRGARG